jgi:hypothetical protein
MGNLLENFSKQKPFGYFLFNAIEDFVYSSYGYWSSGFAGVIIIHDLVYLAIAAVLVLLGLKVLGVKMSTALHRHLKSRIYSSLDAQKFFPVERIVHLF